MTDLVARIDKLLSEAKNPPVGTIAQRNGKWYRVGLKGDWRGPYGSKGEAEEAMARARGKKAPADAPAAKPAAAAPAAKPDAARAEPASSSSDSAAARERLANLSKVAKGTGFALAALGREKMKDAHEHLHGVAATASMLGKLVGVEPLPEPGAGEDNRKYASKVKSYVATVVSAAKSKPAALAGDPGKVAVRRLTYALMSARGMAMELDR